MEVRIAFDEDSSLNLQVSHLREHDTSFREVVVSRSQCQSRLAVLSKITSRTQNVHNLKSWEICHRT